MEKKEILKLLVKPDNAEALKTGLNELMSDPETANVVIDIIKDSKSEQFAAIKASFIGLSSLNNLFLDGINSSSLFLLSGIIAVSTGMVIYFFKVKGAEFMHEDNTRQDEYNTSSAIEETALENGKTAIYNIDSVPKELAELKLLNQHITEEIKAFTNDIDYLEKLNTVGLTAENPIIIPKGDFLEEVDSMLVQHLKESLDTLQITKELLKLYVNLQIKVSDIINLLLTKCIELDQNFPSDLVREHLTNSNIPLDSLDLFNSHAYLIKIALLNCS